VRKAKKLEGCRRLHKLYRVPPAAKVTGLSITIDVCKICCKAWVHVWPYSREIAPGEYATLSEAQDAIAVLAVMEA
jgi:hypothetical protein